ncbi:MAG: ribulose-phosphate 3-epimerase [Chloroflexi bacterium RBG_16_68_14]|nr:MAG: ribulose-phosphate 3-epimerase [Chloroflexi bacterium RBG_16_68_14]
MAAIKIAPSFLTADLARLADEVRAVEEAGADYLHLDVMDGHFVPPITFGALVVEAMRKVTRLPLDVHLMIERPERQIEAFAQAGSAILNVHAETCSHLHRVLQQIKALGCRAGVCLNPGTPLSAIKEALEEADQVMVMGVNPGWGGQSLLPNTLPKVRRLRALLDERGLTPDIEIDGGVKVHNAAACAQAGATVLVAGSAVFNDEASVGENMAALRQALAGVETRA